MIENKDIQKIKNNLLVILYTYEEFGYIRKVYTVYVLLMYIFYDDDYLYINLEKERLKTDGGIKVKTPTLPKLITTIIYLLNLLQFQ